MRQHMFHKEYSRDNGNFKQQNLLCLNTQVKWANYSSEPSSHTQKETFTQKPGDISQGGLVFANQLYIKTA